MGGVGKFPPEGKRRYDCAGANVNFALSDTLEFLQERNQETFRVFQIEDREAVACIQEIATTDRVDGLFIGPRDLTISYGIPFKRKDPLIKRAMDEVANAAARPGNGGVRSARLPESAQRELIGGRAW